MRATVAVTPATSGSARRVVTHQAKRVLFTTGRGQNDEDETNREPAHHAGLLARSCSLQRRRRQPHTSAGTSNQAGAAAPPPGLTTLQRLRPEPPPPM